MDLFKKYLKKKNSSKLIKRALTDNSYKNEYQRINGKEYQEKTNEELATFGDAVLKMAYSHLFLDKVKDISQEKMKVESDKYFVEVVAKHYDLVKYIRKDSNDCNLSDEYVYTDKEGPINSKYIATALEAVAGAIYLIEKDINPIIELLKTWILLKPGTIKWQINVNNNDLIVNEINKDDCKDFYKNISNDKEVLKTFESEYFDNFTSFEKVFSKYIRDDIFAIRTRRDNKLIGIIDYFNIKNTKCEVGYCIGRQYWNNGYMTDVLKAFIDFLFKTGFHQIYAGYYEGNKPSKRVMEKCGMKYNHEKIEKNKQGAKKKFIYYLITKSK